MTRQNPGMPGWSYTVHTRAQTRVLAGRSYGTGYPQDSHYQSWAHARQLLRQSRTPFWDQKIVALAQHNFRRQFFPGQSLYTHSIAIYTLLSRTAIVQYSHEQGSTVHLEKMNDKMFQVKNRKKARPMRALSFDKAWRSNPSVISSWNCPFYVKDVIY